MTLVLPNTRLRNPELGIAEAAEIAAAHWGVRGELTDIGSLQDRNFRIRQADGRSVILKVANAGQPREALELEHAAQRHLAGRLGEVAVPRAIPAADGSEIVEAGGHLVRLTTWIEGVPLARAGHLDARRQAALGALAAQCTLGLADFDHPAAHRPYQWDTRCLADVIASFEALLTDDERALLDRALEAIDRDLAPVEERLPQQVVHSDATDHNVVGTVAPDGTFTPTGLIDFGDVIHTWRLCDPAAAVVAAIARQLGDPLGAGLAVLHAYRALAPLEEAEADAFWPVVVGRAALCAASTAPMARHEPDNAYATESFVLDWQVLEAALAVPPALARGAARDACGFAPVTRTVAIPDPAPLIAGLGRLEPVDLGVDSPVLADGNWTEPLVEPAGATPVGRWGETRLAHSGAPGDVGPDTLHLGADLFVAAGTPVQAPAAGTVVAAGDAELVIDCGGAFLRLAGIESDVRGEVARGQEVGRVAKDHLHVQLAAEPDLPGLGNPRERGAWLALCPDPSALLGIDAAAPPPESTATKVERRRRVLAGAQGLYYGAPLDTVRGWRHHLYDADGRPYLDMVNNIAVVGHSHPRITEAAVRGFRLLNTNSRFLYDSMTEYAERVSALLPPELDTVFLVNSGSEALDLCIQLARTFTGRHDIAAIEGAYHGWTGAVFEACTAPQDNPSWRESTPPYIHVVAQPDPYRGAHGADAAAYADSVRAAGPVAGFLSEALLGNQGAVVPPPGYLEQAYAAVREQGGVCIADEVQVGYARTGTDFWAFEHEGVVPDIVATAKATGNGHPIGVVVCRREIADALGRRASFFSSTGGGPVSCRIGLAVLDVIRDERLQQNALTVGTHLKRRLEALAETHDEIGAVNGRGLYLGVDLVRDRVTKEPAPEETSAICERMRDLGVIIQPTGDAYNVLKVKPPLCLGIEDADFFVDALGRVLAERAG